MHAPDTASVNDQFIVMIVPRLTSSRVFVRRSLAAIIDELGHLFASEVEAFLAEERKTRLNDDLEKRHTNGSDDGSTKEERIRTFTPRMLAIAVSSALSVHVLMRFTCCRLDYKSCSRR